MAVPHYIFWPFDIRSARLDRARTRAEAHAEVLWMGVLAQEEEGPLADAAITHLRECIGCADHFLEPGKALHTLAVDEEAAAAQD